MKNKKYRTVLIMTMLFALVLTGCRKKQPVDLSGIHTTAAETMASETKAPETTAAPETTTPETEAEETSGADGAPAGQNAAAALSVRSKIATEINGKVSVEYPILSNLRDSATEGRVNELLKETALRVVSDNGLKPETDTVSVKCKVISLDRNRAVISYDGSMMAEGAAHPTALFYTATVDLNKAELVGLTAYADAYTMAGYILSDDCVLYKPAASADVLAELKAYDIETLTEILEACDFASVEAGTFPQSFSYENQGDIYMIVPVSHALGDYAIVRYSPSTK